MGTCTGELVPYQTGRVTQDLWNLSIEKVKLSEVLRAMVGHLHVVFNLCPERF